jgi:hypothetical protein
LHSFDFREKFEEQEGLLFYAKAKVTEEYAKPFYDDLNKPIQYQWRMLYNDYCDRVRMYVNEADLADDDRDGDRRHVSWTEKDEKRETFRQDPGTMPT